ncbi:MAG TPA: EAL domain-containing protein [Sphingobium sp.]
MIQETTRRDDTGTAGAPSLTALMGLASLPAAVAEQFIGAQFRAVDRMLAMRVVLGIISVAFVLLISWDLAPVWMLASWALTAAVSIAVPFRAYRARNALGYEALSRRDLWWHAAGIAAQGLVWVGPMVMLAAPGGLLEVASLWTMTSCLIAAVAMGFYPTPLSAIAFLLVVGGGSMQMMWRAGSGALALTVGSFGLLMLLAALRQARMFGRDVATSAELTEKQETVSMLLREYDDSRRDWLWQTDMSRRLSGVTPHFARMLNVDPAALEGRSVLEILAGPGWETGDFYPVLHTLAARLKGREAFANLVLPVEINGERRWWELSASPRQDERGAFTGFRGVGSDVTAEKETAERITQLAMFDPLTGLPNRLHLTEELGKAVEAMTQWNIRCAFLMIDLDRFKAINDTLGHHIGDLLLAQVAERLRLVCADGAFCGRLGGDEFAVLVPELGAASHLERLSADIIARLSQPYAVEQHTLFIGASVGSATGPNDGRTADTLIRSADLAMYRAKDEGGGRHFAYVATLHADAEVRRKMEMALRCAIDNGELRLEYQPVVDSQTGELYSFESLVRWHHPDFGEVPPSKFIRLAEEARLIAPLGAWILETACTEAARWPGPVGLSVNLSAEQLSDPDIIRTLEAVLAISGLEPHRLELEITESIFMREGSEAVKRLEQITALGVGLALDDFGTGYSSFGYLSRIRFRTIKIDRSFVTGAAVGKAECVAIINAVVALATSLDIATVAEGVETEQELEMIRRSGCLRLQGYYIGRAMRTDDVRRLFVRAA